MVVTNVVKAKGDVTKAADTLNALHKIMVEAKEKKEVEEEKQIAAREIAANSVEAAAQQVRPSAQVQQGGDKATTKQSSLQKGMTVDAAGNIAVQVAAVSPATSSSKAEDMRQDEWHKWKSALPVFPPVLTPEAIGSGTASEVRTMQDQGIMHKSGAVHFKQKTELTKLQKEAMEAKEKRQAEEEKQIAAREIAANSAEAAAQQAISTVQMVVDSKKKTSVAHHDTQEKAQSATGESNREKEAEIDLVQNAEASANRAASVAHIKSLKAANNDKSISEARLAHKKLAQMAIDVLKHTPSRDVGAVQPGAVHVETGMAKWKQLEDMAKEHIAALEKRRAHSLAFMRQLAKTSSFQ